MSRLAIFRKLRDKISPGFRFSRPLVLLQSDDWGRVGVRDAEGLEELRAAGLNVGERPYDLYSLETAEDVHELADVLQRLRDSAGQPPCLEMNFVVANVDFAASAANGFSEIALKQLADGLPGNWSRPGLLDAYQSGFQAKTFSPALHGTTHFCQQAVARALSSGSERGDLLRTLWKSETPYIHWRMPWVGYEYWDPEQAPAQRFIPETEQVRWIDWAAEAYRELFHEQAVSACAPGYRAESTTHRAWKNAGVRIVQNGPDTPRAPHWDELGILHIYRALDCEPALNSQMRWEDVVENAAFWLTRGLPFVLSLHSINFHSTLAPNRRRTLPMLRDLLCALTKKYPDLLFVNSRQLLEIIEAGSYQNSNGRVSVTVTGGRKGTEA